jgi:hypothetical protein
MLIAALCLNLVILLPVIATLTGGGAGADAAFGPVTDARLILTAVYGGIALVSAGLLLAHGLGWPWAVPMTVALFAMQIGYKTLTIFLVGPQSPVVMTNILVIVVQVAALTTLALRS